MATTKELEIKITHIEDEQLKQDDKHDKLDQKVAVIWDEIKKLGYMITAHTLTAVSLLGAAAWFVGKSSIKITLG